MPGKFLSWKNCFATKPQPVDYAQPAILQDQHYIMLPQLYKPNEPIQKQDCCKPDFAV